MVPMVGLRMLAHKFSVRRLTSATEPIYVDLERHYGDGLKLLSAVGILVSFGVGGSKLLMNEAIDKIDIKLVAINTKMEALNMKMDTVLVLVNDTKQDHVAVKADMHGVKANMGQVEGEMKQIQSKLDTLLSKKK